MNSFIMTFCVGGGGGGEGGNFGGREKSGLVRNYGHFTTGTSHHHEVTSLSFSASKCFLICGMGNQTYYFGL